MMRALKVGLLRLAALVAVVLAENFQTGLRNLKAVAKKRRAAGQEAAPPAAQAAPVAP